MKITAEDLYQLQVVEKIIPEFGGADQDALHDISMFMKYHICGFLKKCSNMTGEELAEERYRRFRRF